jgi:hypothetical protein
MRRHRVGAACQSTTPHNGAAPRRGAACVLAMTFLVLLSTLSLGFYASTTMSSQIASNEDRLFTARLSAESGMEFMRYQLGSITLPAATPPSAAFDELYSQLKDRLGGTMNMGSQTVGLAPGKISVPDGDANYIQVHSDGREFRADITSLGDNRVRMKVTGRARAGTLRWANQMDYQIGYKPSKVFDYGLASRGAVTMDSNARLYGTGDSSLGNVLISNTSIDNLLTLNSNSSISGGVAFTNPDATLQVLGTSTIAGSNDPAVYGPYVTKGEPPQDFPEVITAAFKPYAGNALYGGTTITVPGQTYDTFDMRNVLVKANTNPTFTGGIKVEGVIYIETPNNVRFDSNVIVRGVIAVQDNPTGSTSSNSIRFDSSVKLEGLDKLPASAYFPPELRAMNGSLILAPKFNVHFNSNFGAAGGSIVAGKMYFDSNAVGTLKGALISLEDAPIVFNGNAAIGIESRAALPAAGLSFKQRFLPQSETYREVVP